jgi:hypothetical protein
MHRLVADRGSWLAPARRVLDSGYLTPPAGPPKRDRHGSANSEYAQSYLVLRVVIGVIGLALPAVLLLGDALFLNGTFSQRGSLSAYYYSGMREVFVGALVAIGVFLVTYKVLERSLENTLSLLAGVAVIVVALFPTSRPTTSDVPDTALQSALGMDTVAVVHFAAAAIFIAALAVITRFFARSEGERHPAATQRRSPAFWRRFHLTCASVIAVALAFMAVCKLLEVWGSWNLLVGETVAVLAFGASWLFKGAERDVLARLRSEALRHSASGGAQPH